MRAMGAEGVATIGPAGFLVKAKKRVKRSASSGSK